MSSSSDATFSRGSFDGIQLQARNPNLAGILRTLLAFCCLQLFAGGPLLLGSQDYSLDQSLPNFVLILADDLGYGDIGYYGGSTATPNLDRLAREGIRFTNFYASGPVCSPTRAGLLTGRYQQRAGIPGVVYASPERNRHHGLQPIEITVAERLRESGYITAIFGKWHLGYEPKYNPVYQGFDQFRGYVSGNVDYISHVDGAGFYDWWDSDRLVNEQGYVTRLITRHAVEFIEENKDRPFFLYLPHEAPHSPFQGPNDQPFRFVNMAVRQEVSGENIREAFKEMIAELDAGVGEVLNKLEDLGLGPKTFVFFLSDNGATEFGSNGPLRGYKGSLWEGGIRVPALAWWPGRIEPGTTMEEPAISLDLMPTLLNLARVSSPEGHRLDGFDLSPWLLKKGEQPPRMFFWSYNGQSAVRDGSWKLVKGIEGQDTENVQLYNLDTDIGEAEDLAQEYPQRVQIMLDALQAWQEDVAWGATLQPLIAKQPVDSVTTEDLDITQEPEGG